MDKYTITDPEYDTDTVSLTSFEPESGEDENEDDVYYEVEDIIAEKTSEGETWYLVKWKGYHMFECTLEPSTSFADPRFLETWKKVQKEKGRDFQSFCERNLLLWDEAKERARTLKNKKRAKKREKLRAATKTRGIARPIKPTVKPRKTHTQASKESLVNDKNKYKDSENEDDDDHDAPLVRRPNIAPSQQPKWRDSSEMLFVEAAPEARRLPFSQSSSSSSEAEDPDSDSNGSSVDSMMEELFQNAKKATNKKDQPPRSAAISQPPLKRSEQRSNPILKNVVPKTSVETSTGRRGDLSNSSSKAAVFPTIADQLSHKDGQVELGNPTKETRKEPRRNSLRSEGATTKSQIKAPTKLKTGLVDKPIKMFNEPKSASVATSKEPIGGALRRSSHDGPATFYAKMSTKWRAERNSRNESTPDSSALQFLNSGQSASSIVPRPPLRTHASDENPYARREVGRRRIQEERSDDESDKKSKEKPVVLTESELGKIPLTCWEWRNGSCYKREKCRYLHRDTGKLAPVNGSIPPKYMNPPQTCFWWMTLKAGCKSSDEDCNFAHKNTGLLARPDGFPPQEMDPTIIPVWQKMKLSELTCWYWKNLGTCKKPAEKCKYKHYDTGTVADPAPNHKHYDTGTVADPPPNPNPNPNLKRLICKRWKSVNGCMFGDTCRYLHIDPFPTEDQGEPISQNQSDPVEPPANNQPVPPTNDQRAPSTNKQPAPSTNDLYTAPPKDRRPSRFGPDLVPEQGMQEGDGSLLTGNILTRRHSTNDVNRPQQIVPNRSPHLQRDLKERIEGIFNIEFDTMFEWNSNSKKTDANLGLMDRVAFLIFHPSDQAEELELLTRWLLMHNVEVCSFWAEGSWNYFKDKMLNGGSGVILTHPDFQEWWKVPEFGRILSSQVRIYSINPRSSLDGSDAPEAAYECVEIFPHGGFIYISDEVFQEQPVEAQKIINLFCNKVVRCGELEGPTDTQKKFSDGCLIWRLALMPDFLEALVQWCEDRESEMHTPKMQALAKIYDELSFYDYIEQKSQPADVERPLDYYPILSENREFVPEYYERLARSQEEANRWSIELYIQVLIELRREYRQFIVVHTKSAEVGWQNQYQNIAEIITPAKLIQYLEEPDREGMPIDFFHWAMPEKAMVE
ncbi:hypothetical protein BU24DRAFT_450937 [Aaosphaeria arxii CBS 175.79]|uniref:Chromo domain-containing protein n=1 Tax=Aaosphaeria arxii CBS 175.79 TaxID=1450172 RepID=A0A6A5XU19_9PLEO|nr:uncharacterized protein BU24DRAFT_450937 [Aaosphaeria arxii CBS 175.79]KAF2016416.1 hypothetical protein BU24DRAFT_450937 [Aaosphaeria arxii CBS 175.79]